MTDELSITLSPADLPALSADIDVPDSGPASVTVQMIGDARARAHDVMSIDAAWSTHTATYPGMTGISGASVKRGLDGNRTTLKAWELQGAEFRLPELTVYTIAVPDGDKTVMFADLDSIVVAAAASAGAQQRVVRRAAAADTIYPALFDGELTFWMTTSRWRWSSPAAR